MIQNYLFDGRGYNVLTQNATVRDVVDTIEEFDVGWRYQHFEASGVSSGVSASVG